MLDELLPAWLEALKPVVVRPAASASEREDSYRLRYNAVVAEGWAPAAAFPDGLERDDYDDIALHVGAWLEETLLASTRVVFPAPGLVLPTEAVFGLRVEPVGQVFDLGRAVVSRGLGARGREALVGILLYCWREARSKGMLHCCGALSTPMIRLCKQLAVEARPLGASQVHMGEERYPIILDLEDRDDRFAANVARRLAQKN